MPTLPSLITTSSDLLKSILPLLVSFGVLYFAWGIIQYFIADSEEAKTKGRDTAVFGVIGLAVIVSLWGLVGLVNQTFGLSGSTGLLGENAPTNISKLAPGVKGTCSLGSTFPDWLNYFTCIIGSSIIPFLFSLAVVMFVWGTIKFFIIDVDEEAKREQGRQFMLWGIIALAVMVSVWGLVGVLTKTFNINSNLIPQVQPPK
jgi:uncharacterized membrane protein